MTTPITRSNPRKRKNITTVDLTNDEDVTPRFSKAAKSFPDATAPSSSSRAPRTPRNRGTTTTTTTAATTTPTRGTSSAKKNTKATSAATPVKKTPAKKQDESPEKRPKRFRDHPPANVVERMYRCRTQKMFVVDRERVDGELKEVFKMAGTTGNVYTVTICAVPTCDCPDSQKNGTCKHILYIMLKVLKAPSNLVYQAGLLTSELENIFSNAPPAPSTVQRSNRKPLKDEDCPICYSGLSENESIVWCQAQCGSNIHTACFKQWAATCKARGAATTCVMCRQPWKSSEGDVKEKLKKGEVEIGEEGYANIAEELGITPERDTSTYHRWYDGDYGSGYRRSYHRGYRGRR